ncbi:unnamed protein product [Effrenium voratum]|uniref:Uncharacterized protein n=1 Tax=Effrenium voratum TaxID=2562239 RepID=A0AA36NA99_9DINO|nr:unnamed protein product [Effrenium voratum]
MRINRAVYAAAVLLADGADHTSRIWRIGQATRTISRVARALLALGPQRRGISKTSIPEEKLYGSSASEIWFEAWTRCKVKLHLPREQGQLRSLEGWKMTRKLPFTVHLARPRLDFPCGVLDFEVTLGRLRFGSPWVLALLGSGEQRYERPFQQDPNTWTLPVSACFGRVSGPFERQPPHLPKPKPKPSKRKQRQTQKATAGLGRGDVLVREDFLQPQELSMLEAWESRCQKSLEKSEEKNEGEECLARGCVAYCGLWQMAQVARPEELQLLLEVTKRSLALVRGAGDLQVTAYEYSGQVWPHWATFQNYQPGGKHILHPDTDKGEHCLSLAVSFSTHGADFTGGEIKIFECPKTVPDCGNRGRARTFVPVSGGPFARQTPNGSVVLKPGEWLWDGEPEAAFPVRHRLLPKRGKAIAWLSETVHQAMSSMGAGMGWGAVG